MKDAYYFPHDANARHDPKITMLCMKFGLIAYACYFIIIEMLREQPNYKILAMLKPGLSHACSQFKPDEKVPFDAIFDEMLALQLLMVDDGFIYSTSLCSRMEAIDNRRVRLQESGRKGGLSHAKAMLKQPFSSKVKKSKVRNTTQLSTTGAVVTTPSGDIIATHPYLLDGLFLKAFNSYLEARRKLKKPATDRAQDLLLKDLHKYSIEISIKMIEQSIKQGWVGIFPLKDQAQNWSGQTQSSKQKSSLEY